MIVLTALPGSPRRNTRSEYLAPNPVWFLAFADADALIACPTHLQPLMGMTRTFHERQTALATGLSRIRRAGTGRVLNRGQKEGSVCRCC